MEVYTYIHLIDTPLAPQSDDQIQKYVHNLIDGLKHDIEKAKNKDLAKKIIEKIELRL